MTKEITLGINIPSEKLEGELVFLEIRHLSHERATERRLHMSIASGFKLLLLNDFYLNAAHLTTGLSNFTKGEKAWDTEVGRREGKVE